MKVTNHKLAPEAKDFDISFEKSPNVSGEFKSGLPDSIILHYTAGASLESSVAWLKNPQAKASAHLVVCKTGKIVQLAPFNIRTWHAGRSIWNGRKHLNLSSIGIEIDNAGLLHKRGDGYYASFGKKIEDKDVILAAHKHQTELKAWEAYTPEQVEAVEMICLTLMKQYESIKDILGHEDISPGRKVDPGPAFPLQSFREKILFGRGDEESDDELVPVGKTGVVTADLLNIRSKPILGAPLAGEPLGRGTKLKVEKTEGGWSYVKVELEGWVSSKWVKTFSEEK
ncbi:N-acetylmuramoyl-L-alanine amidase [Flammeovirgaceae bacterium SG7u.111]|nr:N-acetylmuramoyl-L-alanine amidase [Flammeovirgaceae bacterium SG7u.132]WPO36495.1 N-acetylmuramoyl-L-alanine amidase [Flammeovirgaceae bacterium SG7u.111]